MSTQFSSILLIDMILSGAMILEHSWPAIDVKLIGLPVYKEVPMA